MKAFNPLPSEHVQKKIDFFFMPYAPERNNLKHMKFGPPLIVKGAVEEEEVEHFEEMGHDYIRKPHAGNVTDSP